MRPRPEWRAPKTRHRKQPGKPVPPAMLARRSSFGDFSEGTGRRQCVAMSRQAGRRCRKDAIGGELRCKTHGGVSPAVRNAMREAKLKGKTVRRSSDKSLLIQMRLRALCGEHEPLISKVF